MTEQPAGPVVLVDTREPKYMATQLARYGLTPMETLMPAGDYGFFPHGLKVLIERKTIDDLLSSISSKRLVAQAHKTIEQSDVAILLIEGEYHRSLAGYVEHERKKEIVTSGWAWDSFTGILLDLKWMGFIVHECYAGEAPREIARLVGSLCKDEHKWIRERERPNVISIDKQWRDTVWSLCAFDGVGTEWAESLLRRFGSYWNVVTAPVHEIATVKNKAGQSFGKRAEKLVEEWTRTWHTSD